MTQGGIHCLLPHAKTPIAHFPQYSDIFEKQKKADVCSISYQNVKEDAVFSVSHCGFIH